MIVRPSPCARGVERAASALSCSLAASTALALLASCATTAPAASDPARAPTVASATPPPADAVTSARTALLWVNGMGCPLCSNNVDQQLRQVRGVEDVRINLGTGLVSAELSATEPPTEQQLATAIDRTGFTLVRIQMPATTGGAP